MSGDQPNGYDQPFFIITWVEFGLGIILMAARCFAASRLIHNIAMDLYLAIATFVRFLSGLSCGPSHAKLQILGAASMVMLTLGASYGLGLSQTLLSFNDSKMALLYGWVNQLLALIAIGLGKLTMVAFLEQIQGYHTKARSIILWSLAGSNLILNCIAAILMMLQCSPTRLLWEAYAKGGCPWRTRIQIFGYIQGRECSLQCSWPVANANLPAWSAVCDFVLAMYPVTILARVQAFSITTRIGLCVLMGCGIMYGCLSIPQCVLIQDRAGACAIVKTVQLTILTRISDPSRAFSPCMSDAQANRYRATRNGHCMEPVSILPSASQASE